METDAARAVLNGKTFAPVANDEGEGTAATTFHYYQQDDVVWADYSGGPIRRGYLVGTRERGTLTFRYVQVNDAGEVSSGSCASRIELLADGRLRLHESWRWESKAGAGSSVVEQTDG